MALCHLRSAGASWDDGLPCVRACSRDELRLLDAQLARAIQCAPTSSMGRLFDAISSIAGVCHRSGYEAQAAADAISGFPPSIYKDSLLELCSYSTTRQS